MSGLGWVSDSGVPPPPSSLAREKRVLFAFVIVARSTQGSSEATPPLGMEAPLPGIVFERVRGTENALGGREGGNYFFPLFFFGRFPL